MACVELPPEIPTATPTPTPEPISTPTPIPTRTPRPTPEPVALPRFAVIYTIDGRPYSQSQFQFDGGHDRCGLPHVHSNVAVYPFQEWIVRGGGDELQTVGDAPLIDPEPAKCGFGTKVSLIPFGVFVQVAHYAETCGRIEFDRIETVSESEANNLAQVVEFCDSLEK